MRRRLTVGAGTRKTVTSGSSAHVVELDDCPWAIHTSRDGKRLLVVLPWELWVFKAEGLELERAITLASARPDVSEAFEEGGLWFGGQHLHRGSLWTTSTTKLGTKLGGFVDRVCQLSASLLCGVGSQGEVLWDIDKQEPVHRRKASEHAVHGLVASPDGRAIWADGSPRAWVIDPDHPSGYMQLRLRATSENDVAQEGIVAIATTSRGACVLAARDGAVAWTNRALRLLDERVPKMDSTRATPLAVCGTERWIYVVRPGGVLHRFLVEQPPQPDDGSEAPVLPEAQACRLERMASCIALASDGQLVLAGPHADGQLGRLWQVDPEQLAWERLPLTRRVLREPVPEEPTNKAPTFIATRSKLQGPPLAELRVDDVLAAGPDLFVTTDQGTLLDRPVARRTATQVLPRDTLLLPAMIRVHEGTARPALLLWPGTIDEDEDEPAPIAWLAWGDAPRGWILLDTPQIRQQGWSRRDVFPLQVALASPPPDVAGRRRPIPSRWVDAELFAALSRECKKLLKVLW